MFVAMYDGERHCPELPFLEGFQNEKKNVRSITLGSTKRLHIQKMAYHLLQTLLMMRSHWIASLISDETPRRLNPKLTYFHISMCNSSQLYIFSSTDILLHFFKYLRNPSNHFDSSNTFTILRMRITDRTIITNPLSSRVPAIMHHS
jgi:hypothetical protein